MAKQNQTGETTENWVKDEIIKLGIFAYKPIPDVGVDLIVTSPKNHDTNLNIQVKGRGEIKINRYWKILGPGLVTGASDDYPSGISTYSQASAGYGLSTLWNALITFLLIASIQL